MLIYPQWLNGDRLSRCTDEAQMHFPRLVSIANGYGRMELSYRSILLTAYPHITAKPTKEQILGWIREFQTNRLLFIYTAPDGTPWAEWTEVPPNALPRFKTAADNKSPAPPADDLAAFIETGKAERRRAAELSGDLLNVSEHFGNLPNSSGNSKTVPLVVVVLEGGVVLEGAVERQQQLHVVVSSDPKLKKDRSATKPEVAQGFVDAWNANCGTLSTVKALTDERIKSANARAKEGLTTEAFAGLVDLASRTPFCRGQVESRRDGNPPWRCSFDWLLKPGNTTKIEEGTLGAPDDPPKVWLNADPRKEFADLPGAGFMEPEERASA